MRFDPTRTVAPNAEMLRLREMLDFSAICGFGAHGAIELWTRTAIVRKEDPIGLSTAEEAFELIREEVGA